MKKLLLLLFLLPYVLLLSNCSKNSDNNTNPVAVVIPTLTTIAISGGTGTTAISGGDITSDGGSAITAEGVIWSTSQNPTISLTTKTSNGTAVGSFTSNLSALTANTTYYVVAYATNSAGTAYGNQVTFTTNAAIPTLTTTSISSITATTAISGGNITSNGGSVITAEGVIWSTSQTPTISLTTKTSNGTAVGGFTSNLSGLTANTTYYIVAYATNSAGTAYGNQVTFTTNAAIPTLTTTSISGITGTTAISGGNITSNGGSAITAEGIIWSTSQNPTISLTTKTSNGTAVGSFTSNLTGLTANTTYYVVAYATNSAGTAYGNQLTITTASIYTVTTLAGSGAQGSANGMGTAASFYGPTGVAVDAAGNVYVGDAVNNLIRKISPSGVVTTLAGSGAQGSANGTGTAASFYLPQQVAVDAAGNVYVGDAGNNLIRKISPSGVVITLAGSGAQGSTNGTGTAASFSGPTGVALDAAGNVYVADRGNNLIRKINPSGVVTTLAGSGAQGSANGTGTAASFSTPQQLAVDVVGNIYVVEFSNLIRKIGPSGAVSTLAGSGAQGSANGTGTAASFYLPQGVAVDVAGNVYVADQANQLIRKISALGVVTTLAGSGAQGSANGTGTVASFNSPNGVAVDAAGNVYIADTGNNLIRKIAH